MASPPIKFVHKNDIEWIIQLWLAIHGGDPAPDAHGNFSERVVAGAASQLIKALSVRLPAAHAKAVTAALAAGH